MHEMVKCITLVVTTLSLVTLDFDYVYKELLHYMDLNFIMFMNRLHSVNGNQYMRFKWNVLIVH